MLLWPTLQLFGQIRGNSTKNLLSKFLNVKYTLQNIDKDLLAPYGNSERLQKIIRSRRSKVIRKIL